MVSYGYVPLDRVDNELRAYVREVIRGLPTEVEEPLYSTAVSRALGAAGLVGLSVPQDYGGHERSAIERFIVMEELLAHDVPIHAHYIADRQAAPMILRHGTEQQRQAILPALCRGEIGFSIGLSEPQAGSDLANIQLRASRDGDGWVLNGRKIWTSFAHRNRYTTLLARSEPRDGDRHAGLSQFIVDLGTPGIVIQPIRTLDGNAHFCEVIFDNVWVAADALLGTPGAGWRQVMDELSYERSGPDRYLSSFRALSEFVAWRRTEPHESDADRVIGELCARLLGVRLMSLSVAKDLDSTGAPLIESALVKDLGTALEQEIVGSLAQVCEGRVGLPASLTSEMESMLLISPSFTLRGGSSAVLRSLAARSITPGRFNDWGAADEDVMLISTVQQIVDRLRGEGSSSDLEEGDRWNEEMWEALVQSGFAFTDEAVEAESGQTSAAAVAVGVAVGRTALAMPLVESGPISSWAGRFLGIDLPDGVTGFSIGDLGVATDRVGGAQQVEGRVSSVPWGRHLDQLIVAAPDGSGGAVAALVDSKHLEVIHCGSNIAGEPRDHLAFDAVDVVARPTFSDYSLLKERSALLTTARLVGSMQRCCELTVEYTHQREQFGRQLAKFQSVEHDLVRMVEETALSTVMIAAAASFWELHGFESDARRATVTGAAAVAAVRASRLVGAVAHQLHGAIGLTAEYPLHQHSRRLHAWRSELLALEDWRESLGRRVVEGSTDHDELLDLLTLR